MSAAKSGDKDAFVDLISIGEAYPLLGKIDSPQLPAERAARSRSSPCATASLARWSIR